MPSETTTKPCPDCEQVRCQCAEWQRLFEKVTVEEAEATAAMADTLLPYLWSEGPEGLLRRKST